MKPPTIPTIELSQETGTLTNALDIIAWLRLNSPDWSHIEDVARLHQMNRIERLELLALSFGLALERAKQDAVERELRHIRPIFVVDPAFPLDYDAHAVTHTKEVERLMEQDPFATPLDEGFEICEAKFVQPQSPFDRMLRIHKDALAKAESSVPDCSAAHAALHQGLMAEQIDPEPEPLPGTLRPKDPADLAPAVFIGIGLFFAIAAGVLAMTGHGLAAGICGLTSLLSLVRASKFPA